jgi:hypothetical protein
MSTLRAWINVGLGRLGYTIQRRVPPPASDPQFAIRRLGDIAEIRRQPCVQDPLLDPQVAREVGIFSAEFLDEQLGVIPSGEAFAAKGRAWHRADVDAVQDDWLLLRLEGAADDR